MQPEPADTERRYSQTEKEALVVVWACERLHAYLYGTECELMTDHKPLECIFSPKSKTCARIKEWLLRMHPYRFIVKYIPDPKNIADCSCLAQFCVQCHRQNTKTKPKKWVAQDSAPVTLTTREIERASEHDAELKSVPECLEWEGACHRIQRVPACVR